MFEKVAIIGLGLIGASIAQAIADQQLANTLVAVDARLDSLQAALADGVIQQGSKRVLDGIADCDLIIIATPTKAVQAIFADIHQAMLMGRVAKEVIITDVASTKGNVLTYAKAIFGDTPSTFVPAHPIAGAEKSGYFAKNPKLFDKHKVIICPHDRLDDHAKTKVVKLWQALGAEIGFMEASHHDKVLAYTSHLPHLLASNLTYQLASHDDNLEIFRYAAGGFRDYSRIAASDPVMWHDIFLENKTALLAALDEHNAFLAKFRTLIANEESDELKKILSIAKNARQHFAHMLAKTPTKHTNSPFSDTFLSAIYSQGNTMQYHLRPSHQVSGTIRVAGDKSISHRSIMFGALADGVTHVTGFLEGEDALATLQAFRDMGVSIHREGDKVSIYGVGIDGLKAPKHALDMGNSGTSMRLLSGILAAQAFDSVLIGDVSLSKRPMERVATPLRSMGAVIQTTGTKGTAPLSIKGGQVLQGIDYSLPVASAQIKSCLLLAGVFAKGVTTIIEPEVSRDHTERMLTAFGYPVTVVGNQISVTGGGRLSACDITVPADISSAAFFMVAAAIAQSGSITLKEVGMNPTRTGVIEILRLMGADIVISNERVVGGEPIAEVTVSASELQGIEIPEYLVPLAIDEFPVLFVAASCAIGQTKLTGAKELRVKESDRIQVMADGLVSLGIECTVLEDGIIINGKGVSGERKAVFGGGVIESHHDHRIAMSFSVASLRASDDIIINGTETVATSFPNFAKLASEVGLNLQVV